MIVYKLTSPDGKVYIGITSSSLEDRFNQHVYAWKVGKRKLYQAFDQHDPSTWTKEIVMETDNRSKEKEIIEQYNAYEDGYNMKHDMFERWRNGVFDNRPKPTPETIEKRRLAQIGFRQTEFQKKRATEVNSQKWIVTKPDGTEEHVLNLFAWCRANGLDQGNLSRTAVGKGRYKHKGYWARKATKTS